MEDRRAIPREPASEEIVFSITVSEYHWTKRVEARARVINKTEKGLCLITPFPIEAGHVLIIDNREIGLAIWSRKEDSYYIAGVLRKGKVYGLPED